MELIKRRGLLAALPCFAIVRHSSLMRLAPLKLDDGLIREVRIFPGQLWVTPQAYQILTGKDWEPLYYNDKGFGLLDEAAQKILSETC